MTKDEFWMELYLAYTKRGDDPGVAKAKADDGARYVPMCVKAGKDDLSSREPCVVTTADDFLYQHRNLTKSF